MVKGKIKWYNDVKGFGFITSDNGDDVFIHRSGLGHTHVRLDAGVNVEFEIKAGDKGMVAFNVQSVKEA